MNHLRRGAAASRRRVAAHELRSPARPVALRLVGGFELIVGGTPMKVSAGIQRLLAFLALHDRPVRRAYLAGSLWPDVTEGRASAGLRTALWKVGRTSLALVEGTQSLALAHDVRVDFHAAIETAQRAIRDCAQLPVGERRLSALHADLLPDWPEDWVAVERERFREVRVRALEAIAGHLVEQRSFDEAALTAFAAIRAEPLRESAHRALIAVYLSEGNRHAAVRQFERLRRLLNGELGIEPSGRTLSMLREIVRPDPWLRAEQAAG